MNNLRKLSNFFIFAAILTLAVAFLMLMEYPSHELEVFLTYILFMIPVIFASIAVSLRFIAKALDERADS